MKTTIKNIALLLAAALPAVAIASTLGAPLPAAVNFENGIGAFTLAFGVLLMLADYARPTLTLDTPTADATADVAARACEPHRLAA